MPRTPVSRLRPILAALALLAFAPAGAGADKTARDAAPIVDPAIHTHPHGDTPHDTFAGRSPAHSLNNPLSYTTSCRASPLKVVPPYGDRKRRTEGTS
jgi:hypothetical protein